MSNGNDELLSEEGQRNPPFDGMNPGPSQIQTVWGRSGDLARSSAEAIELPSFEIVRKGFSPDQVRGYVTQLTERVRNLERLLEDQRLSGESVRVIEQEFGNPAALLERVETVERELYEARMALNSALVDTESAREAKTREVLMSGGTDAYGAIASQVAELLRAAGLQGEQIRRVAVEEADRLLDEARQETGSIRREAEADADVLRNDARVQAQRIFADRDEVLLQARREADEIRREAESYAEALRWEAQQESERIGNEREEVIREARGEADRIRGGAEADTKRHRGETERALLKARGDAERMLSAAISRRDLVKAEMHALRERLAGAVELLERMLEQGEPVAGWTDAEAVETPEVAKD